MSEVSKRCSKCEQTQPVSSFPPLKRNYKGSKAGDPSSECKSCNEKAEKCRTNATLMKALEARDASNLPTIRLDSLLERVKETALHTRNDNTDSWDIQATVNISEICTGTSELTTNTVLSRRNIADGLAEMMWEVTDHRYV
jgi:hypothetical protein